MTSGSAHPLVSVLLPTYNGEAYLSDALRSAGEQSYEHLEIIVSDDGSTDDTLDIVHAYAATDQRVEVHTSDTNQGPVANFTRCLSLASGPYIKYLMQDDLLRADAVERLLVPMLDDEGVVLATSRRTMIGEHGERLPDFPSIRPPYERDTVVPGRALADVALAQNLNLIGEPSTVCFRRSALGEAPPFCLGAGPYRFLADMALWVRLLSGGRAAYLVDPLSCSRQHPDQDSAQRANKVISVVEWLRLLREAREMGYLAEPEAFEGAVVRWLGTAPFFFRFCSTPTESASLFQAIASANGERLELAKGQGPWREAGAAVRSAGSSVRAGVLFPAAALWAAPARQARARVRTAWRGVNGRSRRDGS